VQVPDSRSRAPARSGATAKSPAERTEAGSLSIVVPVFNSEPTLGELAERVAATASTLTASWELILVNDGSTDRSWERIRALAATDPRVRGIDLAGNFGQHNALLAGLRAARHELIVTLDDDLQNPPEEIPKLLGRLSPELDVVYGVPTERHHPLHRRLGGRVVRTALAALSRHRAATIASGFRAVRSELAEGLDQRSGRRVSLDALMRARTDRFSSVAVEHEPRRVGRSNYTLTSLVRHAAAAIATDLRPPNGSAPRSHSYVVREVVGAGAEGNGDRA
jgi:undecaprenyl-phosphate 4-deoxy-4-formamido-L-arabinose transferase